MTTTSERRARRSITAMTRGVFTLQDIPIWRVVPTTNLRDRVLGDGRKEMEDSPVSRAGGRWREEDGPGKWTVLECQ